MPTATVKNSTFPTVAGRTVVAWVAGRIAVAWEVVRIVAASGVDHTEAVQTVVAASRAAHTAVAALVVVQTAVVAHIVAPWEADRIPPRAVDPLPAAPYPTDRHSHQSFPVGCSKVPLLQRERDRNS